MVPRKRKGHDSTIIQDASTIPDCIRQIPILPDTANLSNRRIVGISKTGISGSDVAAQISIYAVSLLFYQEIPSSSNIYLIFCFHFSVWSSFATTFFSLKSSFFVL